MQESRFWFAAAPSILILVTWMQASFPAQSRTFKRHGSSVASPSGVTPHPTCFTALCHHCSQTNWVISTICWVSPWKRNSSSKTKELKGTACPGVPTLDFQRTQHTQVRPLYSPQSHLIRHLLRGSPSFNLTHTVVAKVNIIEFPSKMDVTYLKSAFSAKWPNLFWHPPSSTHLPK